MTVTSLAIWTEIFLFCNGFGIIHKSWWWVPVFILWDAWVGHNSKRKSKLFHFLDKGNRG